MICPNCKQEATTVRTAIREGKLVTTCESCTSRVQPHELLAKNRREQMKKDYRRDLVQPVDPKTYSKAYPEQARQLYGDDAFRKLA